MPVAVCRLKIACRTSAKRIRWNLRGPVSIWGRAIRIGVNRQRALGTLTGKEQTMKQYLLTIYQPDGPIPPRETLEKIMRDVYAVRQEMKDAGAWVFSGGLFPASTATVVRTKGGETLLTDGPYVE